MTRHVRTTNLLQEINEGAAVSEPDEDFAAMFEASLQAKRIGRGQTIEGTIVAIGPEVALVDVGSKGEAAIEIAELKDADGNLGSGGRATIKASSPWAG